MKQLQEEEQKWLKQLEEDRLKRKRQLHEEEELWIIEQEENKRARRAAQLEEEEKWKKQLQKEEEDKWNKEREAQRLKRLKQQRDEEEKWERQQKDLEGKRKAEEEMKRNRLSFSSLPIRETKTISFEKILSGSALQQSLLLTQQAVDKEERKQNRVSLTFTISGIPERLLLAGPQRHCFTGRLEPKNGWFYSDELIIYRAKTWEIPEPKIASIDRIVIRALPESIFKSVTVKYTWFG